MTSHLGIWRKFALVALAAFAVGAPAQPLGMGAMSSRSLQFSSSNIVLLPIRLEELADNPIQTLDGKPRQVSLQGSALIARGEMALPPVRTRITRTIHGAWLARVDQQQSNAMRVEAFVESTAGQNVLTESSQPNTGIKVEVIAKPAQRVSGDKTTATMSGDVDLVFDLRDVKIGGHYTGRLVISIEGT